jgi:predicted ribonuclease YlaK
MSGLESISMLNRRQVLRAVVATVAGGIVGKPTEAGLKRGRVDIICARKNVGFHSMSHIRGQRANDIICDEYSSISPELFKIIIKGFKHV